MPTTPLTAEQLADYVARSERRWTLEVSEGNTHNAAYWHGFNVAMRLAAGTLDPAN